MANSDKNILITPSVGLSTNPTIKFNGANNTPTTLRVLDDGTVSFEGTAGQLFSISDGLTGSIFSVNDISGIPSIEVLDTGLVKLNQYGGSAVFGSSAAIQNASSVNAKVSISTASATTPGLIIKGVSSQSANLQEWQDSTGTANSWITASGSTLAFTLNAGWNINWGNTSILSMTSAALVVNPYSASRQALVIKGAASQTATLQEWQNSAGSVLSYIGSVGQFATSSSVRGSSGGIFGGNTQLSSAGLTIYATAAGNPGAIIRGAASQTANLQEWQDSSGTALSYITKDGTLDLRNTSATAFTNSNSGTVGPKIDLWGGQYGIGIASGRMTFFTSAAGGIAIKQDSYNGTSKFDVAYNGRTGLSLDFYQYTYPTVYIGDMAYGFSAEGSYLRYYTSGLSGGGHVWYGSSDNSLLRMILSNNGTLLLRGISAQTADLQQWQNSAGSILTRITSSGNIGIGVSSPLNKIEISHAADMTLLSTGGAISATTSVDANNGTTTGYVSAASSLLSVVTKSGSALTSLDDGYASFAGGIKLTGDGTVNQTISLAATGLLYGGTITTHIGIKVRPLVNYGTGLITNQYGIVINSQKASHVTNSYGIYQAGNDDLNIINGRTSFNSGAAGYVPVIVKAAASQTANLQEWQDSAGTILTRINSAGNIYTSGYLTAGVHAPTGTLTVVSKGVSVPVAVIQGAASQTADLQQWQDSAGSVKALIGSGGNGVFNGIRSGSGSTTGAINAYTTAAQIGILVRGAASQTANLQEWQNSAGTVLASIDANGQASFKSTTLTALSSGDSSLTLVAASGQTAPLLTTSGGAQISAGGNYFRAPGIEATYVMNVTSGNLGTVPFTVKGAASQTADLQQWNNSSGTVLSKIRSDGQFYGYGSQYGGSQYGSIGALGLAVGGQSGETSIHYAGGSLTVRSSTTGDSSSGSAWTNNTSALIGTGYAGGIGLIIKSVASQTADLQQWQDSAGTVLAYVAANGHLLTPRLNITNGGNIVDSAGTTPYFGFGSNQISIYARNAAYKPLVIQGASSQTANLQEWQDSSGNVLSKIDSFGAFKTASKASFGTISGGGVWGGYSPVVEIRNPSASTSAINIFASGGPAIRVYDGSGYQRGSWNQDGSIVVGQSNTKLATLSVYADSAVTVGTIIRGAASQTADLQQWQNSAGTTVATMSPGGDMAIALRLTTYNGVSAYNASTFGDPAVLSPYAYSNMVGISTGSASNVGLVIKGVTSQTGDLQQWRDGNGNILTGISSNGLIYSGKSYSSYNIESAGTLASSESIANTFNLQGKNNLIYPSTITDVGGNGWTSVTPNYGIAPDGTQTSTRYVWNLQGNCYGTASDSNPNTYAGDIYTVSAYIKINSGTGSFDLRYSKADSSKNAGIRINLSTKTATAAFDASDYNVLSYSLVPVGKNWYRAIATIKVLVNHTIERVIFAATGNVGDIEVWGFQLEKGLSASPLTSTTNSVITTINTLNIPYGQINLQSNASTIGLIIKSANSQTANLTEWQTSTGAVVASIDPNGSAFFNSNFQINGVVAIGGSPQSYSQLIIQTNSATRNGLVIKGASGQSANLQEWRNSSGTIMARITPSYIFEAYNGVYSYQLGSSNDGSLVANMGANGSITFAGTVSIPTIKSSTSSTISVNTAATVDTVALSSFTSMEYTLSIKQGSKIRSSKVLVHTDGTSVDSTEYGIMEMGGGISGILVTASVSGTNAILQVTITDAATTNATVKLIKTML